MKELFKTVDSSLRKSNLSTGELKGMALLAEDRSILISESRWQFMCCSVGENDYTSEAGKKLSDTDV